MLNISQCYSTGTVRGVEKIGGLVGFCSNAHLINCYSTSNLEESPGWSTNVYNREYMFRYFGGLIGTSSLNEIINCYCCGKVADVPYAGYTQFEYNGFAGPSEYEEENIVSSSFFDIEEAGRSDNLAISKITQEMKQQGTFIGWDFISIWGIDGSTNDGYPYLLFSYVPVTGLDVFIITDLGLKQVSEIYLITDTGLMAVAEYKIISDTGLI